MGNNFRGGFGGGGGNMQQLMMQAQKMQQQMAKAQEELKESEVTGKAGGDMVSIVMTGDKQLVSVTIKPEAVDPEDIEMLEDLVAAAFNDAMTQADELSQKLMGPLSGSGLF